LAESGQELVLRYLQDALATESVFEVQLREFAQDGDDDEVKATFATHADQTRHQRERLAQRLEELGASPVSGKSFLAEFRDIGPKLVHVGHIQEERTTQNLMMGFALEMGECAMYEALAVAAGAAGDPVTAALARGIQAEEWQTAGKLWRFLPSRAKIAFNMLTLSEVDPAVETRTSENRIV
jgi:ferritin-like metal-binding protein YciE